MVGVGPHEPGHGWPGVPDSLGRKPLARRDGGTYPHRVAGRQTDAARLQNLNAHDIAEHSCS